jgi:Ni/Fe-hydrogenase subunit HybB-like protein
LVRGAYIIGAYGAVLLASLGVVYLEMDDAYLQWLAYAGMPLALLTGVYTAFLLNQALARPAWTSKWLAPQFVVETVVAGACMLVILSGMGIGWMAGALVVLVALGAHQRRMIRDPQLIPLS